MYRLLSSLQELLFTKIIVLTSTCVLCSKMAQAEKDDPVRNFKSASRKNVSAEVGCTLHEVRTSCLSCWQFFKHCAYPSGLQWAWVAGE